METTSDLIERAIKALGGPTRAAVRLWGDPKKQTRVSNWKHRGQVPASDDVMQAIERESKFAITRHDLRPDIYGPRNSSG